MLRIEPDINDENECWLLSVHEVRHICSLGCVLAYKDLLSFGIPDAERTFDHITSLNLFHDEIQDRDAIPCHKIQA